MKTRIFIFSVFWACLAFGFFGSLACCFPVIEHEDQSDPRWVEEERGIDFYSLSLQDTNQQTIVTDWSLDSNNLMIYGLIQNSNANLRIFVTSSPSLHFSVCSPPLQTTGFVSSQCERTDNIVDASNQFCENIDQDQRKCHYRFDVHETIKYPDDSNQKIFDQYIVSGTVEITIFEHFEDSANYCHSNWS